MRSKRISDEQFLPIMECRQSGLSDYQWCQMNDINSGSFYNWISRLRKRGITCIVPMKTVENLIGNAKNLWSPNDFDWNRTKPK